MNTITLRTLLREPRKVKRMTSAGKRVRVTDKGQPLWILHPAGKEAVDESERHRRIEAELAAVLKEPKSHPHLSKIVLQSRR